MQNYRDGLNLLFEKIHYYREHLLNFSSFIFLRLLVLGLFALAAPVYIKYASKEKYGLLFLVFTVYNFLGLFDLGFGYALNYRFARSIARNQTQARLIALVRKALPFYWTVGVIAGLLIFLLAPFLSVLLLNSEEYTVLFRLLSVSVFLLMLDAVFIGIMNAYNKIYITNFSRFIFDIGRSAAMLLSLFFDGDLAVVLLFILLISVCKLLFDIYACGRMIGSLAWLRPVIAFNDIWLNLRFGMPMLVATVVSMTIHSFDKFYIGKFFESELPYYSIAFDLNSKVWLFVYAINSSLYTILIRRGSRQESQKTLILISLASVAIVSIFYYLPVSVLSFYVIKYWISEEFAGQTYVYVRYLAVASVLYLLMSVLHNLLQSARQIALITYANMICLVVLVGLVYFLAESYGVYGVAAAYSIMYVLLIVILAFGAWRKNVFSAKPKNE